MRVGRSFLSTQFYFPIQTILYINLSLSLSLPLSLSSSLFLSSLLLTFPYPFIYHSSLRTVLLQDVFKWARLPLLYQEQLRLLVRIWKEEFTER